MKIDLETGVFWDESWKCWAKLLPWQNAAMSSKHGGHRWWRLCHRAICEWKVLWVLWCLLPMQCSMNKAEECSMCINLVISCAFIGKVWYLHWRYDKMFFCFDCDTYRPIWKIATGDIQWYIELVCCHLSSTKKENSLSLISFCHIVTHKNKPVIPFIHYHYTYPIFGCLTSDLVHPKWNRQTRQVSIIQNGFKREGNILRYCKAGLLCCHPLGYFATLLVKWCL